MRGRAFVGLTGLPLVSLLCVSSLHAQITTCKTSNCAVGKDASGNPILPAECQNIASPRIFTVNMDGTTLRFVPSALRLEGESTKPGVPWEFQCIQWRKTGSTLPPWHSATDDTGGVACSTAPLCSTTNTTPPCDWETGNIDGTTTTQLEYSVCSYAHIAATTRTFRCRLHSASGMVGSLTVVTPIELTVDKGASGEALVAWSTGGVGPWDLRRDTTGPMPAPTLLAGTTATRNFSDSAALSPGGIFFYLTTEHN